LEVETDRAAVNVNDKRRVKANGLITVLTRIRTNSKLSEM
jgi:hypothetical protein